MGAEVEEEKSLPLATKKEDDGELVVADEKSAAKKPLEDEQQRKDEPLEDDEGKDDEVEEDEAQKDDKAKPSYTLHIKNLPEEDFDVEELEARLQRYGNVVSVEKTGKLAVVKFSKTKEAYQAKEKLDGSSAYGEPLKVEFGPQDPDHYVRHKRRPQGVVRKEFLDGDGMVAEIQLAGAGESGPARGTKREPEEEPRGNRGLRGWTEGGQDGRRGKVARLGVADAQDSSEHKLSPPAKPVSQWSPQLKFEAQLEDFMKMTRRGLYNRYLVLGKLPPELRTGEAVWRMAAPVQRDIVQVEMLMCFQKPVAHVTLRSATAAATMHRLAEQLHPQLTVAFAPPRRASASLWLGNIDDFVPRKALEGILQTFGKLKTELRYHPARTCAFVTYNEVGDAILARNTLYAMEVQKNQYLNIDFVEESSLPEGPDGAAWAFWSAAAAAPWGARPPGPPWGGGPMAPPPWAWGQHPPPPGGPPGPPWQGRGAPGDHADGHRRRSRSRRGRRSPEREPSRERPRRRAEAGHEKGGRSRAAPAAEMVPVKVAKEEAAEPEKVRVKLYKMGEFCCNIVATFVKGNEAPISLEHKLQIDQRTKVDHCRAHLDKAGSLATIWHFSAADRKDCAAYDALCDYFIEKQRVGLVQVPAYYVYVVPPTPAYLDALGLPPSNFVVGLQIPIKK
mmetsp:Transcript_51540/g.122587  ORF Transcript_51540/g.122587 Transcript_51540/m.122587 type:complete len:674 (-) Transcript_51540:149-2170(-)